MNTTKMGRAEARDLVEQNTAALIVALAQASLPFDERMMLIRTAAEHGTKPRMVLTEGDDVFGYITDSAVDEAFTNLHHAAVQFAIATGTL